MIHRDDRQIDVRTPACDRFDELLPDWLEGTLPASLRLEADRHRAECARCAALASDLQEIAHTAAALPRLRPDRDLWAGIAERIEPTVVPLDVRRVAADATPRRTYTFTRRWLGAAAAALVAVTSGITYIAVRPDGRTAPPSTASSATPAPTRVATADTQAAAPSAGAPSSTDTAAESRVPDRGEPTRRGRGTSDARLASRSDAADAALVAAAATYDREIASLRAIVTRRRADLDSGTVAVLERNLRIIDQAIAQSRAALARDPRSQFLGEQLTRALDSKVELLRTAALLPQRGT
jgi:hypothetical protein